MSRTRIRRMMNQINVDIRHDVDLVHHAAFARSRHIVSPITLPSPF